MRQFNAEKPDNQWNTVELICFEGQSLHIVNGQVVMVLKNSRYQQDGRDVPMWEGKIQLQSEAAEVFYKISGCSRSTSCRRSTPAISEPQSRFVSSKISDQIKVAQSAGTLSIKLCVVDSGVCMSSSAIALITGASRGIGTATARLFAQQGYALGLNYQQDHGAAEALANELRAGGCHCILLQADIGNEAQVLAMFQRLDTELGPLSVLVNNAGILQPQSSISGISAARFAAILQTNVIALFYAASRQCNGCAQIWVAMAAR